jgi:hypothetical protein
MVPGAVKLLHHKEKEDVLRSMGNMNGRVAQA